MIERLPPLSQIDEAYLTEAICLGIWGERLQPFLSEGDYQELRRLCDTRNPEFALRRADFHLLQTFTLAVAKA